MYLVLKGVTAQCPWDSLAPVATVGLISFIGTDWVSGSSGYLPDTMHHLLALAMAALTAPSGRYFLT